MSDGELFQRLSEQRLRDRSLWAGAAISLGVLMPFEVIDEQPHFVWQIFGELAPSGVVAALSFAVAGLVVLAARRLTRRAGSLAVVSLAALAGAALCHKLGADASAWSLLPLPQSYVGRGTLALLSMALTAAGSNLSFRPATRKAARVVLWAAVAAALVFYLWPSRGEAPGTTVVRNLALIGDMPTLRFQVGLVTLAVVALWPALIALAGLNHLRRPPSRSLSALSMAALFGFPLILMMLLFSWYMRASPGAALFGALGAAIEISAVLALGAAAFEVLGQLISTRHEDLPLPRGWPLGRAAAVAAAAVVTVSLGQWLLALPPDKGVEWELGPATAEGDELFGGQIVGWSQARHLWDQRVRKDSSATELLEVKSRGRAMVTAAEKIDPALSRALAELAKAAWHLDTSSRTWYRRVAEVNAACRAARLPYYLDPRVSLTKTRDGLVRRFLVDSYQVDRVRRFEVDGAVHATLHVRGLGPLRGGHRLGLLGFSRDMQPFALVVLDSTDDHARKMRERADAEPPRCGDSFDPPRDRAMLRCGEILRELTSDRAEAAAAVQTVERHELQHQIDGPLLPLAEPVLRKLAGYTDETQDRVNRELSAYVAELTVGSARLGLIEPFRFAVLTDRGIYHHASVLLLEALAGRKMRSVGGEVEADEALAVLETLIDLGEEGLRLRARQVWEELFDSELFDARPLEDSVAPPSTVSASARPPASVLPPLDEVGEAEP